MERGCIMTPRTLQNSITWEILTQEEICEILDSKWGKAGLRTVIGNMMVADNKLTPKQHRKVHGYEGGLF